jgi:glutathione S-transferase
MDYLPVADAKARGGLRLVLTAGVPGPWGESAKYVLHVKGLAYAPVAQFAGMPNQELVEWTGCANAPVAVYENESPRSGWAEILLLAERLSPEPRLIPADAEERAAMFGLCHEICGEQGFGWSRRLMLIDALVGSGKSHPIGDVLAKRYGWSKAAAEAAPHRVASILHMITARLRRQLDAGHEFLFGASLSAADLYWAAFSGMILPLEGELCPLPDALRGWYTSVGPVVADAIAPELIAHRDRIYRNYLPLPMTF